MYPGAVNHDLQQLIKHAWTARMSAKSLLPEGCTLLLMMNGLSLMSGKKERYCALLLQMYIRQFREMAKKKLIPDYEEQGKPLGGPVKVEGRGTPALPGAESASIE